MAGFADYQLILILLGALFLVVAIIIFVKILQRRLKQKKEKKAHAHDDEESGRQMLSSPARSEGSKSRSSANSEKPEKTVMRRTRHLSEGSGKEAKAKQVKWEKEAQAHASMRIRRKSTGSDPEEYDDGPSMMDEMGRRRSHTFGCTELQRPCINKERLMYARRMSEGQGLVRERLFLSKHVDYNGPLFRSRDTGEKRLLFDFELELEADDDKDNTSFGQQDSKDKPKTERQDSKGRPIFTRQESTDSKGSRGKFGRQDSKSPRPFFGRQDSTGSAGRLSYGRQDSGSPPVLPHSPHSGHSLIRYGPDGRICSASFGRLNPNLGRPAQKTPQKEYKSIHMFRG